MTSGVEIGNQFAVARMFGRFPSEIGPISSLEFNRFEEILHEEKRQEQEKARDAEREARLRRM